MLLFKCSTQGVLRWFAELEKARVIFRFFTPRIEATANEIRAIVDPKHGRKTAAFFELLKYLDDALSRQAGICFNAKHRFNAKHLPIVIAQNIQHAERTTVPQTVVDVVQAPDLVRVRGLEQPQLYARWQSLFRTADSYGGGY